MKRNALRCALAVGAIAAGLAGVRAADSLGYKDTPMLPGDKWHVHDGDRPQPPAIDPGTASTPDAPGRPPADAVVLFDGSGLSKWQAGKGKPAGWKVENAAMEVPRKGMPGAGDISTRDEFGDCQLHVEWAAPVPAVGSSQGRGNSGIFLMGRYEIQVLDCYENKTYPDGQAASLYGQYPPLVNACRRPGEWQTYDILFTAPRFKEGKIESPPYVTLLHNGVVVHHHTALLGPSAHRTLPKLREHPPKGPIRLQDHGNPVRYRNIWIRELKGYDEQ